jgi:hypothetical protein
MSKLEAIRIVPADAAQTLTPAQKRFNTLIRQIEQSRKTLAAWQDNVAQYAQAHTQLNLPLHQELQALRRQWAFALDAVLARKGWTRTERGTLSELVCDAAAELLAANDADAELKALFAKHAEVDFDTERVEALRAIKDMAEFATGLDLGEDEDITSEDDLMQRLHQRMQEHQQAADAAPEAQKPPRRQSAAQQRREAEAQQVTQSVREVFRKLASALHPDRETDEEQRTIKTALMQRANQAYANNDLLTLLELQLQIEQVDAGHMAGADAQRVKHYNKVLAEQLAELKAEIDRVEMGFRMDFGLEPGWGMNPLKLGAHLQRETQQLRFELAEMSREMALLDDAAATKRWLKLARRRLEEAAFDRDPFF